MGNSLTQGIKPGDLLALAGRDGDEFVGKVQLVSANGRSMVVNCPEHGMLFLLETNGRYEDILTGTPVTVQRGN